MAPMPQAGGGVAPHPAVHWTPPPLPPNPASEAARNEDALLLIRAMIAAANADHAVDDVERHAILGKVTASGLGAEEHSFIEKELANPLDLRALVGPGEVTRNGRAGIRGFRVGLGSRFGCGEELLAALGISPQAGHCNGGKVEQISGSTKPISRREHESCRHSSQAGSSRTPAIQSSRGRASWIARFLTPAMTQGRLAMRHAFRERFRHFSSQP